VKLLKILAKIIGNLRHPRKAATLLRCARYQEMFWSLLL
jgi:hypothetical protein